MIGDRGRNWSAEENMQAGVAFVQASQNSIDGCDQKIEAFTKDVEVGRASICEGSLEQPAFRPFEPGTRSYRPGRAVVQQYKKVKAKSVTLEQALMRVDAFKVVGDPILQQIIEMATVVHLGKVEVGPYQFMKPDSSKPQPCQYRAAWKYTHNQHLCRATAEAARQLAVGSGARQPGPDSSKDTNEFVPDASIPDGEANQENRSPEMAHAVNTENKIDSQRKAQTASTHLVGTTKAKREASEDATLQEIGKLMAKKSDDLASFVEIEREQLELERNRCFHGLFVGPNDTGSQEFFKLERKQEIDRMRTWVLASTGEGEGRPREDGAPSPRSFGLNLN